MPSDQGDDAAAIRDLISRQFASLTWTEHTSGDWQAFAADSRRFSIPRPGRRSRRPFRPLSHGYARHPEVPARERGPRRTLRTSHETVLGTQVHVFGNIAVAIAAAEMIEDDADTNRNVEMLLLVKSDGAWCIVCQAWDRASQSNPALAISSRLIALADLLYLVAWTLTPEVGARATTRRVSRVTDTRQEPAAGVTQPGTLAAFFLS